MKITQIDNKQNTNVKAFIANKKTARLINNTITTVISACEKDSLLGLSELEKIKYKDHYITRRDQIEFFIALGNDNFQGKALNHGEYIKNLLDKAKEVTLEDVEKFIPKLNAAKAKLRATEDEVKIELNLGA